jgi:acyl-CoA reductase-like NAD-dependent aldehyde dehydrogenase
MNIIRLEGLTPLQAELADRLWQLSTPEQVSEWLATLPQALRRQAQSLMYLITVECIDQDPLDDLSEALAVIESVR